MDDDQLLRYSRHLLLNELGPDAQARYAAARALVVGVGGLGNPAAHFLAASGVGTITLVDADAVDLTNLQGQILFASADVGTPKVDAAARRLAAVNPEVHLVALRERVDDARLAALVARSSAPAAYDAGATLREIAAAVPAFAGIGFDTLGSAGIAPQEPGAAGAAEAAAPAQA